MDTSTHKRRKLLPAAAAVLFSLSVFSATAFATSDVPPKGQEINAGISQATTDSLPTPPDVSNGAAELSNGGQTDPGDTTGSGGNQNSSGTGGHTSSSSGTDENNGTESGITSTPDEPVSNQPAENSGATSNSSKHSSRGQTSSKAPVYVAPPAGVASAAQDSRSPTDFTSEDLQGLLSGAGSSLASTDGFLREDTPTNGSSSSGGISSLLLGGIALILAGLAGVVLFVYRQFFLVKKRPAATGVTGPIPAIPMSRPAPGKAPAARPQALGEKNQSATQAQPQLEPQEAATPDLPSGNYTDISSGRTPGPDRDGFDWDQFFKNIPPEDSSK
ncbi:hypothetical protein [Faecalispora anaeroviscerum]|uniref:hypothetical protein n=1 Tax=Faecalispora anaeroviscerum TaxID=2991836 RepID=UPI0024B8C6CE|nr:hypothetical protein [Faecalispora anaeroviscerum]